MTGSKWSRIDNWETIGTDLTSPTSKSARNKRHPQAGHFDENSTYDQILEECYNLLKEIRPYSGIEAILIVLKFLFLSAKKIKWYRFFAASFKFDILLRFLN